MRPPCDIFCRKYHRGTNFCSYPSQRRLNLNFRRVAPQELLQIDIFDDIRSQADEPASKAAFELLFLLALKLFSFNFERNFRMEKSNSRSERQNSNSVSLKISPSFSPWETEEINAQWAKFDFGGGDEDRTSLNCAKFVTLTFRTNISRTSVRCTAFFA